MTILNMPAAIQVKDGTWGIRYNTQTFNSPISRVAQRAEMGAPLWYASWHLPPMSRAQAEEVIAFLMRLRGRVNRFYALPFGATSPRGTGNGTPLVKGGSQTGASLDTDGWAANETVLKVGDYFSVNGELKKIIADVTSDGSGEATLTYEPVLRQSPSDNAAITVTNPTATMILIDDEQSHWDISTAQRYGMQFSAIEAYF